MKKITVNVRSFEDIRTQDYTYVDKTKYVHSLVKDELINYYFISRPRRYGKSLMCSTLRALFEGKRELFKGLYIDKTDYSFEKYPVLHFNFAEFSTDDYDAFLEDFQCEIISQARNNGIIVEREEPSDMLSSLLEQIENKVVIIIDEYDTPIIHASKDSEKLKRIDDSLGSFCSVIKNTDEKVRFLFITGITMRSDRSFLREMNNLTDITFDRDYASAFGYTEKEVETIVNALNNCVNR